MGDELDINVIKSTQNTLGKYVKRPPLSDKLLRKPPFRFLHDIITSVLKSTGFFDGLFEEEELNSENVKDRESKILFLNKVITVVGTTLGKSLQIKASKIIAGQEPEKTNELLQSIALALDNKISSDEAVKLYKESTGKHISSDKKSKDTKKSTKKAADTKTSTKQNEKATKSDVANKVKLKENNTAKKAISPKKPLQPSKTTIKKNPEKSQLENNQTKHASDVNNELLLITSNESQNTQLIQDSIEPLDLPQNDNNLGENKDEGEYVSNSINETELTSLTHEKSIVKQLSRNDSKSFEANDTKIENKTNETKPNIDIVNEHKKTESIVEGSNTTTSNKYNDNKNHSVIDAEPNVNDIKDTPKTTRPLSVRPSSSRPGAPRIRDKYEDVIPESDNLLIGKVNIISESTVHEEDDESSIIVIEETEKASVKQDDVDIHSTAHGHLVQQILDSQKEFSEGTGKTQIDWQFGAKKARDVLNQEIEQLRFNVQALSRVANPLGKLLDHIQEDVEVMRQELQQWNKTYEQASKELMKQKATNEESLLPYYSRIKQLDADIAERHEKIDDLKVIIHKNAHRIEKLLVKGDMQ